MNKKLAKKLATDLGQLEVDSTCPKKKRGSVRFYFISTLFYFIYLGQKEIKLAKTSKN